VWKSALHFGQELSTVMFVGAFAPHEVHFTAWLNAIIFGERGPSRSGGFDCGVGRGRCGSRLLSM
jgi:hypothetical protein